MNCKQPLDDTWLFWNPERVDEFPHAADDDHVGAPADCDDDEERGSAALDLLEDLLLYVAGVSAAMVGVGLAVLIGSFISAYSALNSPGAWERAAVPAQPFLSLERPKQSPDVSAPEAIVIEPATSGKGADGKMSPVRVKGYSRELSGI
ncbi:MAG: hypothetical protein OER43_17275 [Gammaproteobacteria bacterium]|nr:hypothetical protein [Gammaproteobacteria bacterium]MDH3412686.1 hypothetical protein [Gammaproteobacteria bacterium]